MQVFTTLLFLTSSAAAYPAQQTTQCHYGGPVSRIFSSVLQRIYGVPPPSLDTSSRTIHSAPKSRLRYSDEVVLRFNISSEEEAKALGFATNNLFLDVWESNKQWADIRIAKDTISPLLSTLPASMQAPTYLIRDLSRAISDSLPNEAADKHDQHPLRGGTRPEFGPSVQKRPDETNIFFSDYQPLKVMIPWMRLMQSLFPTHVRIVDIGSSYEGRSILGLRIGAHPKNSEKPAGKRKTVLITGGSHAREWVSVSSVTYAAYALITSYGKSKQLTKLIEEFDWVFVPTYNPDGYIKTWEHDRLWRKNTQETSVRFCQGYDLDRSFAFAWDGESTNGNPCSESFSGDLPLQAVEALRLSNWVKNETETNNVTFVGYLDLHSYSQQILYPYAFSCAHTPPSLENLQELGLGLAKAIHQHGGEKYGVTSACEGSVAADGQTNEDRSTWPFVENNGGTALDWMYHEMGTKLSFQIKLPDTGSHGFLLPRKYIVPTGEDVFNAIVFFGNYLLSNKGVESIGTEANVGTMSKAHIAEEQTSSTSAEASEEMKREDPLQVMQDKKLDLR